MFGIIGTIFAFIFIIINRAILSEFEIAVIILAVLLIATIEIGLYGIQRNLK